MPVDFAIPEGDLDEFEKKAEDGVYPRLNVQDLSILSQETIVEMMSGLNFELGQRELTCISEPEIFSLVYSFIRGFDFITPNLKVLLFDALAANLTCLPLSITSITSVGGRGDSADEATERQDQLQLFNKCTKMYVFLVYWLVVAAENDSSGKKEEQIAKATGKKKAKHLPGDWDWPNQKLSIMRPMAAILETDLGQLFRGSQPDESFLNLFLKCAFLLLENPNVQKNNELKDTLYSIISNCSVKYGFLEGCVNGIVNSVFKNEQFSLPMAELVSYSENKFINGGLLRAVVAEFSKTSPKEFVRDAKGAKSVGDFLIALTEKQPKAVASQLSLLLSFLGNEPYVLRSAVIALIGKIIVEVYSKSKKNDGERNPGAELTKVQNKDSLLSLLLKRVQDSNAFTRSKVLQTWLYLCENDGVPIGHWNEIAKLAIGRLEDKSSLVRKSALQFLSIQMQRNPFGSEFFSNQIEASLDQYERKLNEVTKEMDEPLIDSVRDDVSDNENEVETSEVGETEETQYDGTETVPIEKPVKQEKEKDSNVLTIRTMVASLKAFLQYSRLLEGAIPSVEYLLASNTATDVEQSIQFLILARQFKVDGAEHGLRKMLPLIFSQDLSVKRCVEEAFLTLYLRESPDRCALNLSNLVVNASLGDLTALEALIGKFAHSMDLTPATIFSLWKCFQFSIPEITPAQSQGALAVIAMASKSQPEILSKHLQPLLAIGFGSRARKDALLARWTCIALQNMKGYFKLDNFIFQELKKVLTEYPLTSQNWASAAEQAIKTIYALHPIPEHFCAEILLKMAHKLFKKPSIAPLESSEVVDPNLEVSGNEEEDLDGRKNGEERVINKENDVSGLGALNVYQLSRFLFLVGHVALEHLVFVERKVKDIRRQKTEEEKRRDQAMADRLDEEIIQGKKVSNSAPKKEEGINAELGVSAQADLEIDLLYEKAEREIVSKRNDSSLGLISHIAPLISGICKKFLILQQFPALCCSAVLSLSKLMAVDHEFCEKHLRLLFTIAQKVENEAIKSNTIIALGDLASRFPNLVEPWTEHMYKSLRDESLTVRKNTVMVLSHLILNDMVKVKGHISELVLKLEDKNERIASLTRLFFHEFSQKSTGPVYNLLPDILSKLSSSEEIPRETLRECMAFLIQFIKKDKQMEGLVEKLCHRFTLSTNIGQSQDIAFCLSLLSYSEKSLKRLSDNFQLYKEALLDAEVASHFAEIVSKAKKFVKPEQKTAVEEFERMVTNCHDKRKEDEEAVEKGQVESKGNLEKKGKSKRRVKGRQDGAETPERRKSGGNKGRATKKVEKWEDSDIESDTGDNSASDSEVINDQIQEDNNGDEDVDEFAYPTSAKTGALKGKKESRKHVRGNKRIPLQEI